MSNPYSSPMKSGNAEVQRPLTKPSVLFWYRIYLAFMLALYLIVGGAGIALLIGSHELAGNGMSALELQMQGLVCAVVGLPLAVLYLAGFFLGYSKFSWVMGIVLIGISMTSLCSTPVSLPLLIFWIRDDNRKWHRVD